MTKFAVVTIRRRRQKIGPLADATGRKGVARGPWRSVSCDPLLRERSGELAVSLTTSYVYAVRKSLLKPLVYVLVAAQLLLSVPAMSFAQGASSASASVPCDEMQSMTSSDHCPCCPDGADSMKDCLASCTLAAAALPVAQVSTRTVTPPLRVAATPSAPLKSISDPPLKPPPIR